MQKWIYKNRKKKGFTLIELVVVIAILGILAAIAVPRLSGFQDTAKKKADVASARTLVGAGQIALAENKAVVTGTTVAGTVLTGYINSWPESKFATGPMQLVNTSGELKVMSAASGGVELYPNTDATYK